MSARVSVDAKALEDFIKSARSNYGYIEGGSEGAMSDFEYGVNALDIQDF
jgi:hypothetical protein